MKIRLCVVMIVLLGSVSARSSLTITPWMPIFQGIDLARGTNIPDSSTPIPLNESVVVARVDLNNPDISLFTTPQMTNYLAESRETAALNVSAFLSAYGLQLAINGNFYSPENGLDPPDGTAMEVYGLAISKGVVVSRQESTAPHTASLLFTTNNRPMFVMTNTAPGTNTTGIYTAVTGYPLVVNGTARTANSQTGSGTTARTAFGVSQDQRFLYLLTIDASISSQGAYDTNTAYWLQAVGAYNGINLDGGGSTQFEMAGCDGQPVTLNRPFLLSPNNHERRIASHLGVYAKPAQDFIRNVVVSPGSTTATISWQNSVPMTGQIEYGPTTAYGAASPLNSRLLTNHVATIGGLTPSSIVYYRIICTVGSNIYTLPCQLATIGVTYAHTVVFNLTNWWRYTTNNLDGLGWQLPAYDDSGWLGPAPGLFYLDEPNPNIRPRSTALPWQGVASPTYYFRTHFTYNGPTNLSYFYLTNYLDDGAVIYFNGSEFARIRMKAAPATIYYTNVTDADVEATSPDVIALDASKDSIPLIAGDNVVAAELHQSSPGSTDAVFGAALSYDTVPSPVLNILWEAQTMTLYWNGSGFTLQQADEPGGPWADVPGPVTQSTYIVDSPAGVRFYRMRY